MQLAQLEEGLAGSSVQPNQRTQIAASGAARRWRGWREDAGF